MISASKEFKEKLKNGANVVNYADITLADGTILNLTYKDFMIGGCTIEDKTTDGKFGVGFCIGKTLTMRIANHDERFSQYDFYQAIINLYVAMTLDDGTIEKIRKGVYYATVPQTPGDTIEISAVDGMYKLDQDYSASTTAYPATLQAVITDICFDCGIPIGFTQFDNMNYVVKERPEKATYRQVLSWACQIAGYNARIDNNGYMQLTWYNSALLDWNHYDGGDFKVYPHDTILDGGNFKDYSTGLIISGGLFTDKMPEHIFQIKELSVHTDDVQITGVKVLTGDTASELYGEEGYVIEVKDNQFASGNERQVADYLSQRIVGMVFRPFSAQVLQNPLYEPFDIVRVSDRKGNSYNSLINSVSYTVGAYTQIACEAEDPLRNGSTYFSEAAAAVVESRKNAEKQLTDYDKAVQNMNQIAMNAMGFHTTYEDQPDGSRITYLHDKPSLSESKIIYKQTIDGFFISQDGGKSYTAGFDSHGNAVLNILYAIGIVADWIRSGKFEVRKGSQVTFLADADTGEVRIVADYFSLSSGDTIDSIAQDKANAVLTVVDGKITAEVTRATGAENSLSSKITQNENSITAEVTRATGAENSLSSKITQNENSITAEVTRAKQNEDTLSSRITVTEKGISSKVSKGDISSEISQESGQIFVSSNRFVLESTNCSISAEGTLKAKNAEISGKITANSGEIGGFTVDSNSLHYQVSTVGLGKNGVYVGKDGISCAGSFESFLIKSDGTSEYTVSNKDKGIKVLYYAGSDVFSLLTPEGVRVNRSSYGDTTYKSDKITSGGTFEIECGNGLKIDTTSFGDRTIELKAGAISYAKFATTTSYIYGGNTGLSIGKTGSKIGFFGSDGSTKKTVAKISSPSAATAATAAQKINDLIDALTNYGLISII